MSERAGFIASQSGHESQGFIGSASHEHGSHGHSHGHSHSHRHGHSGSGDQIDSLAPIPESAGRRLMHTNDHDTSDDVSSSWNADNFQLMVVTTLVMLLISLQSFYWLANV